MQDLKPETVVKFQKIYKDFPELVDYRLKCGNVYEKAQATLIKNVVESVSQIPQRPSSRKICKTPLQMPTFIASDPQEQIDPEMRSDAS
jgi:hypothetical protein